MADRCPATNPSDAKFFADLSCDRCAGTGELSGNELTAWLSRWCSCAVTNRERKIELDEAPRSEPPSSKGPCGCEDSLRLQARVAELEAECAAADKLFEENERIIERQAAALEKAEEHIAELIVERDALGSRVNEQRARIAELEQAQRIDAASDAFDDTVTSGVVKRVVELEAGIRDLAAQCDLTDHPDLAEELRALVESK